MEYPEDLMYNKTHEWVRKENDGSYVVGITDYAQYSLGELVYIELPEEGESVHATDEVCVVESVKSASDVYSPMSGKIKKVNEDLKDAPSLLNKNPYDDGWLYSLEPKDETELKSLMTSEEYRNYIAELEE